MMRDGRGSRTRARVRVPQHAVSQLTGLLNDCHRVFVPFEHVPERTSRFGCLVIDRPGHSPLLLRRFLTIREDRRQLASVALPLVSNPD